MSDLQKHTSIDKKSDSDISFILEYHPPYRFDEILRFFDGHSVPGIDMVKGNEYMRTVHLLTDEGTSVYGWVRVGNKSEINALSVTASGSLLNVISQVKTRIHRMFDLNCNPGIVYETLRVMNEIRPGLYVLGTRLPGCFDTFEMSVRAVMGQQISVKASNTLASRVAATYGKALPTEMGGLTHTFPTPEDILALNGCLSNHFGLLGVIASRSKAIYEIANLFAMKKIDLGLSANPEDEVKRLMKIRGIGSWTAQYIVMRAMQWADAFLETDAGVKRALGSFSSGELLKISEPWRPWRSYATVSLWNTL